MHAFMRFIPCESAAATPQKKPVTLIFAVPESRLFCARREKATTAPFLTSRNKLKRLLSIEIYEERQ